MPSSVQFSVPVSQYYKAYALCSVDPNADNTMVPVITARLTNFTGTGSRPTAICNSTVTLPAKPGSAPLSDNVRIVGGTKDNPVYLVEFNMDVGNLEDVIYRENNQYLDFEFLGKLYDKDNFYLTREQKPSLNRSSVILHAATLKRSPAEFRVEQGRPAATWYLAENPFFQIYVNPLLKGEYTVKTNIKDIHGKTIQTLTEKFDREETRRISFPVTEYGWYGLESILSDSNGNKIISRNSAIVLLPPDTRKAGYESPYFCWNYNGAGYTITDVNIWGDILHRMGVRKTLTPSNHDENTLRQWKLSYMQIPHLLGGFKTGSGRRSQSKGNFGILCKAFPALQVRFGFP